MQISPTAPAAPLQRPLQLGVPDAPKPGVPTPARPGGGAGQALAGVELLEHTRGLAKAGHELIGYPKAGEALYTKLADPDGDGRITDVYLGREVTGVTNTLSAERQHINVEHLWPQSQGASGPARSDLHHLLVADARANAVRSSYPFGNVVEPDWRPSMGESVRGRSASGHLVFEPPGDVKGDIARGMLYFVTRYGDDHFPSYDPSGFRTAVDDLLEWHRGDPVTEAEAARNDAVEALQGNRNPYIDDPTLAARIGADVFRQA
jgi:deoxyribonuclease-1